jgi:multiple sugar transport system permease protein
VKATEPMSDLHPVRGRDNGQTAPVSRASLTQRTRNPRSRSSIREAVEGYIFISPWLLGFVALTVGPIAASLLLSFCRWNLMTDPVWIGGDNYARMLMGGDPRFLKSLRVTAYYTLLSVPLSVACSIVLALLLNQQVRGIGIFRTMYYLPSVTSGVAVAVLWMWIFNKDFGLLNRFLGLFGVPAYAWLDDERLVIPAFVFMGLWSVGGNTIIYLAGLQNVPVQLYESADLDGAGRLQKLFHITLPLITPVIFFNLIMAVIGSFQVFTQAFIMTNGGPNDASMFYVMYLFKNAFQYFRMGYACAMAWILFVVILTLTLIQFALARRWVYYDSGGPR